MSQEEFSKKVHELQNLEQSIQGMLMQKQSIQMEMNESLNALEELKSSSDEVYKIVSGIMIRSDKTSIKAELEEKKKLSEARISAIEKQENVFNEKIEKLRKELDELLQRNAKKK